jgi:hypothetical protein
LSHFWPMLDEADQPLLADSSEEVLDVGVYYPAHIPPVDCHRQGIQRVVRPSPGLKPVGETAEVAFIDRAEYHHGRALDDLILQGGDRQRPKSPVRLRYIRPAGRLRPVSASMDPFVQILEPWLETCLVVPPRHAIHAGSGLAFERVERRPQHFDADMVE